MIEVFPVKAIPYAEGAERPQGARGQTCGNAVWFADWHLAERPGGIHHAQDIFAPEGSHVLAPEAGVVTSSSRSHGPTERGGHWFRLRAGDRTYYGAHLLEAPFVQTGERLAAGDLIGRVGRSGNATSTCPHLHLGARDRRRRALNLFEELDAVNPYRRHRPHLASAAEPEERPETEPAPAETGMGVGLVLVGVALLWLSGSQR